MEIVLNLRMYPFCCKICTLVKESLFVFELISIFAQIEIAAWLGMTFKFVSLKAHSAIDL